MTIRVDQLTEELSSILADYAADVTAAVNDAAKETAKETAEKLKQASPKRTGKYAKDWKYKRTTVPGVNGPVWVVYNDKHYRLTHLLEKGHAKRGGGRTPAIKHIEPVSDQAAEIFEQKALEAIGRVSG